MVRAAVASANRRPMSFTSRVWDWGRRVTTSAPAPGTTMIDVRSGKELSTRRPSAAEVTEFDIHCRFPSRRSGRRVSGRPSDSPTHEPGQEGDRPDADAEGVVAHVAGLDVPQGAAGEAGDLAHTVDRAVDDVVVE